MDKLLVFYTEQTTIIMFELLYDHKNLDLNAKDVNRETKNIKYRVLTALFLIRSQYLHRGFELCHPTK